jgi:hypothetical protein
LCTSSGCVVNTRNFPINFYRSRRRRSGSSSESSKNESSLYREEIATPSLLPEIQLWPPHARHVLLSRKMFTKIEFENFETRQDRIISDFFGFYLHGFCKRNESYREKERGYVTMELKRSIVNVTKNCST